MNSDLYIERHDKNLAEYSDHLGFFRYEGRLVKDGYLAAAKSARALSGIDKALRYFMASLEPSLRQVEFDVPVRIRAGSWEALIPETLEEWLRTGAGAAITTYAITAAKKAAENDVGQRGVADLVRLSLKAIQWFVRVGKHLREAGVRQFDDAMADIENQLVGIRNERGEILWIPKFHFDLLVAAPPRLLSDVVAVVQEDRELVVGVLEDEAVSEVRTTEEDRSIFVQEHDQIILPELEHGQEVELEGYVTRGNRETNSVGFKYHGHIVNSVPETGNIERFKPVLFSRARIVGRVTRQLAEEGAWALKPTIVFSDLVTIGTDSRQGVLF